MKSHVNRADQDLKTYPVAELKISRIFVFIVFYYTVIYFHFYSLENKKKSEKDFTIKKG